MVPVSLLLCMTEMSTVCGVSASATSCGLTRPLSSTESEVTVKPSGFSRRRLRMTALCSMLVVTMCRPLSALAMALRP